MREYQTSWSPPRKYVPGAQIPVFPWTLSQCFRKEALKPPTRPCFIAYLSQPHSISFSHTGLPTVPWTHLARSHPRDFAPPYSSGRLKTLPLNIQMVHCLSSFGCFSSDSSKMPSLTFLSRIASSSDSTCFNFSSQRISLPDSLPQQHVSPIKAGTLFSSLRYSLHLEQYLGHRCYSINIFWIN